MESNTHKAYSYADVPTIAEFARSNTRIRGITGPLGSGKSSGCVMEVIRRAGMQAPQADGVRRTRVAIIRNTIKQLKDTTIRTFFDWFPPSQFGTFRKSELRYVINKIRLPDDTRIECEVLFRALDREEHISNLLSLELSYAWVNEAREVPWVILDHLDGRIDRYPARKDGGNTWGGIFMDTNPPDVDSEWYKRFEVEKPEGYEIFHQPSGMSDKAENIKGLIDGYYTTLARGKSDDFVKVYIHGEYGFVQDGKGVWPEFRDGLHIKKVDPVKGLPMYIAYDFGLTPACVMAQMTPKGQLIIFDEMTSEDMGIDKFSDNLLKYIGEKYYFLDRGGDIGDPAGNIRAQTDERTCFDILAAKGFPIEPAETNDQTLRIESVRRALTTMVDGEPAIIVDPKCQKLRKALQGRYRYKRVHNQDRWRDKPEKNSYSHVADALQYMCLRFFGHLVQYGDSSSKWEKLNVPIYGVV